MSKILCTKNFRFDKDTFDGNGNVCISVPSPPVLMDEGKEEEAIAELSGAIAFKPDLQLLHLRAAFFDSMGERESALRDCEAALCLDPTHGDTLELYSKASTTKAEPQS
jgi:tetratricopeptide (TPR) repeat protein